MPSLKRFYAPAACTGFVVWLIASIFLLQFIARLIMGSPNGINPADAFLPYRNIQFAKDGQMNAGARSFSGNGCTFGEWKILSPPASIERAATVGVVREYHSWLNEQKPELKKALAFFAGRSDYHKIAPTMDKLVGAPDTRYQWIHFQSSEAGITDAGLWICSPSLQTLVLLDCSI